MKSLPLFVFATISALAALFSTGCKPGGPKSSAPAAVATIPAPAWELRALDGRAVKSTEFAGRVVLLNFWATWCPPCVAEIPGFVALQKKYPDDLAVVGVSVDEGGVAVVRKFAEAKQLNYPVLMADDAVVAAFGGMEAIPVTFLIDRQGRIQQKHVGYWEEQALEKALQPLLDDKKS